MGLRTFSCTTLHCEPERAPVLVRREPPQPLRDESESAPNPLTGRVPFRHRCRCGGTEADHGKTAPEAHGGAQAARRAAAQRGGGTAYAEAAREIGADPPSLADRVRRASAAAPDAEASPFQTAEGLRRLRRENERLKRESEML